MLKHTLSLLCVLIGHKNLLAGERRQVLIAEHKHLLMQFKELVESLSDGVRDLAWCVD